MTASLCMLIAEWRPFITPMPVWDVWWILLFPLVIGVSIVYKTIKVESITHLPRAAMFTMMWILIGMFTAAGALAGIVELMR